MKDKLNSSIRHALTAIPALGGYLAAKGWITGPEGAQLDGSIETLLTVIAAIAAAVVTRLIMLAVARYAPGLEKILGGNSEGENNSSAGSGGISPCVIAAAAFLTMVGLALPSCSPVISAMTGQPIPATAVQRAGHDDAQPILIASADLAQAEAAAEAAGDDPPVHGLYDAGRAAKVAREVFTDSQK